jgi:hypothetical protein
VRISSADRGIIATMEVERCAGRGSLVALGHKHSRRQFAACSVSQGAIELLPNPPGRAGEWAIVAGHQSVRSTTRRNRSTTRGEICRTLVDGAAVAPGA